MTPWRQPSRYCGPCVALSLRSLILPTRGREPATSEEARSRPQAGRRRGGVVGGRHRKQVHGTAARERRLRAKGRAVTVGDVVAVAAATEREENDPLPQTKAAECWPRGSSPPQTSPRKPPRGISPRTRGRESAACWCRGGHEMAVGIIASVEKPRRVTSSRTRLSGAAGGGG